MTRRPSDFTVLSRLATLAEGMWMNAETERELRSLGINPETFRELCRERIVEMVEPAVFK